jgi:plastocyanin
MGIMPVAVYDGTDIGGVDAFSKHIPQKGVLTHGHLEENRHHGGENIGLPNALELPNGPISNTTPVDIRNYQYSQGDLYAGKKASRPPVVHAGQTLTFKNLDSTFPPSTDVANNTYHTVTACRAPCNGDTGIAYPIANASRSFDSGELGYNSSFGAPASDRATWTTPKNLKPGTYTYFCRVHPFMRGSFRVLPPLGTSKN